MVRRVVRVNVTVEKKSLRHPRHPNYVSGGTTSELAYYMNGQEAPSYHLTRGLTYQFHMDPIDYAQAPLSLYQSIKGTTTMRRCVHSNPKFSLSFLRPTKKKMSTSPLFLLFFSLFQLHTPSSLPIRYEGGDVTYISPTIANQFLCLEVIADSLSPRTGSSSMTTNTVNSMETLYFDDHLKNGVGGVLTFYNTNVYVVHISVKQKTLDNPYHPSGMPNASPLSYYFNGKEA